MTCEIITSFFVRGIPAPGGSKKFVGIRNGRAILVDSCKRNKPWRAAVAWEGVSAMTKAGIVSPLEVPLSVTFAFYMPRPKAHSGSDGKLKPWAITEIPFVRPDVLKLTRSTEDALTGIVWKDDAIIVEEHITKHYANAERYMGVGITVKIYQPNTEVSDRRAHSNDTTKGANGGSLH